MNLGTCIAGLLRAELILDGHARIGERNNTIALCHAGPPTSPTLAVAAEVIADRGPKLKAVLSHMGRDISGGMGRPWNAAIVGLVNARVVAPGFAGHRPRHEVVDRDRRDRIVRQLRAAAISDVPLEPRAALLLSMAGWSKQYKVIVHGLGERRHAVRRVKHVLDGTQFEPIYMAVRRRIAMRAAAAAG